MPRVYSETTMPVKVADRNSGVWARPWVRSPVAVARRYDLDFAEVAADARCLFDDVLEHVSGVDHAGAAARSHLRHKRFLERLRGTPSFPVSLVRYRLAPPHRTGAKTALQQPPAPASPN